MRRNLILFILTLVCSSGAWATIHKGVTIDHSYMNTHFGQGSQYIPYTDSLAFNCNLVNDGDNDITYFYDTKLGKQLTVFPTSVGGYLNEPGYVIYKALNPDAATTDYFVMTGFEAQINGGPGKWEYNFEGHFTGFYSMAEMADSLVALNNSMTYPLDNATITNYVNTLKQTSASSAREIFEEYCQNIRNHDAEQKRLLAEAKEAAIAEIDAALGDITEATLLATIQGYKDQINAATVIEAIAPIKTNALAAIEAYKAEQERLRLLEEAKAAAIAEIETALGDITDATLLATIQGYIDQINAATVIEAIAPIKTNALAIIDAYKAEQERLRLLEEAKEATIAAIQALVSGSTDELAISTANKYIAAIEAATVIEDVARLRSEAERIIGRLLTEPDAFEFGFIGTGNPIEMQHRLEGLKMTYSADGEQMTVTINGAEVTYPLSQVSELSYFQGTPTISLTPHENPADPGYYYTTFYSGLEAYAIPEGVKAYTAVLNADNNSVTILPIEDGVIAQGTAVLLKATVSEFTMETIEPISSTDDGNVLRGSDVLMARPVGTIYVLSSKKLAEDVVETMAFYKYTGSSIPANKAYIELPAGAPAPARIVWNQHVPTDIENSLNAVESAEKFIRDGQIYIRKGEHIYNGQGMLVK